MTMTLGVTGCTSSNTSPIATATRAIAHFTPTSSFSPTATSTAGVAIYTYMGHSGPVNGVAWSPDGRRIASASADKTVQVWDAVTGNSVLTYTQHVEGVNNVAWSPDSTRVASGSGGELTASSSDNSVQVWVAR